MSHHSTPPRRRRADPPRAALPLGHGLRGAGPGQRCWPSRACSAGRPAPATRPPSRRPALGIASIRSRPRPPPLPAKAKRVIHLFMNGGPSHVDTFDPKPALDEVRRQAAARPTCRPSARPAPRSPRRSSSSKYGQSGIEVSELFAKTAECIDDICVIRSMHADVPNHEPSLMLMNCGEARQARPERRARGCSTAWAPRTRTCPASSPCAPAAIPIQESQNWQSAFLPGHLPGHLHRHPAHRHREADREHPATAPSTPTAQRRAARPARRAQPASTCDQRQREAELEARIQSFELAYRMQSEAADAFDVSHEPQHDPRRCTAPASRPGSS